MNDQSKVQHLAQALAVKTVQLEKAMAVAGRAAEQLKKFEGLTTTLDGLRQILFHQRNHHHTNCKTEGCEWDLGTLAFFAHSMGMTYESFQVLIFRGMLKQYDAAHAKGEGDDAGRSLQEGKRPQDGAQIHTFPNVQGPRPDDQETRRRPDKPGGAPISE